MSSKTFIDLTGLSHAPAWNWQEQCEVDYEEGEKFTGINKNVRERTEWINSE